MWPVTFSLLRLLLIASSCCSVLFCCGRRTRTPDWEMLRHLLLILMNSLLVFASLEWMETHRKACFLWPNLKFAICLMETQSVFPTCYSFLVFFPLIPPASLSRKWRRLVLQSMKNLRQIKNVFCRRSRRWMSWISERKSERSRRCERLREEVFLVWSVKNSAHSVDEMTLTLSVANSLFYPLQRRRCGRCWRTAARLRSPCTAPVRTGRMSPGSTTAPRPSSCGPSCRGRSSASRKWFTAARSPVSLTPKVGTQSVSIVLPGVVGGLFTARDRMCRTCQNIRLWEYLRFAAKHAGRGLRWKEKVSGSPENSRFFSPPDNVYSYYHIPFIFIYYL